MSLITLKKLTKLLWIGWTLTFFFNWIAFFYISFRTRHNKWLLWGLFYSIPFVLMMVFSGNLDRDSRLYDLTIIYSIFSWIASIIHAFLIRNEYLIRLEAFQNLQNQKEAQLRKEILSEDLVKGKNITSSFMPSNQNEGSIDDALESFSRRSLVDINNSTEEEIANLPGIGPILAKKIITLRASEGGFKSIDDFVRIVDLKPHLFAKAKPHITLNDISSGKENKGKGRVIDF